MHNIKRANLLILPSNALATNITNASWRLESVSRQVVHWGGPGVRGSVRATPTMRIAIISTTTKKPNNYAKFPLFHKQMSTQVLSKTPVDNSVGKSSLASSLPDLSRGATTSYVGRLDAWLLNVVRLIWETENNNNKWCWVIINAGVEFADCARKVGNVGKCRLEGNALAPSRDIGQHCIALGEKEFKGGGGGCVLKVISLHVGVLYSTPPSCTNQTPRMPWVGIFLRLFKASSLTS